MYTDLAAVVVVFVAGDLSHDPMALTGQPPSQVLVPETPAAELNAPPTATPESASQPASLSYVSPPSTAAPPASPLPALHHGVPPAPPTVPALLPTSPPAIAPVSYASPPSAAAPPNTPQPASHDGIPPAPPTAVPQVLVLDTPAAASGAQTLAAQVLPPSPTPSTPTDSFHIDNFDLERAAEQAGEEEADARTVHDRDAADQYESHAQMASEGSRVPFGYHISRPVAGYVASLLNPNVGTHSNLNTFVIGLAFNPNVPLPLPDLGMAWAVGTTFTANEVYNALAEALETLPNGAAFLTALDEMVASIAHAPIPSGMPNPSLWTSVPYFSSVETHPLFNEGQAFEQVYINSIQITQGLQAQFTMMSDGTPTQESFFLQTPAMVILHQAMHEALSSIFHDLHLTSSWTTTLTGTSPSSILGMTGEESMSTVPATFSGASVSSVQLLVATHVCVFAYMHFVARAQCLEAYRVVCLAHIHSLPRCDLPTADVQQIRRMHSILETLRAQFGAGLLSRNSPNQCPSPESLIQPALLLALGQQWDVCLRALAATGHVAQVYAQHTGLVPLTGWSSYPQNILEQLCHTGIFACLEVTCIFGQNLPTGSFSELTRFMNWLRRTYPSLTAGLLFPSSFGIGWVGQTVLIPIFGFGARELVYLIISDPENRHGTPLAAARGASTCRALLGDGSRFANYHTTDRFRSAAVQRYIDDRDEWCDALPPSRRSQAANADREMSAAARLRAAREHAIASAAGVPAAVAAAVAPVAPALAVAPAPVTVGISARQLAARVLASASAAGAQAAAAPVAPPAPLVPALAPAPAAVTVAEDAPFAQRFLLPAFRHSLA